MPAYVSAASAAPRRAAARARRRHDAGFHLVLVASLVALALYALGPRMAAQPSIGPALMRWHSGVDRARDRLAEGGRQLLDAATGRLR